MNRRSFVSILTGACGAILAGLGLRKEKKLPRDPSELPWRKGRKGVPIVHPEFSTDTELQVVGPSGIREPMVCMEDGSPNLPPTQIILKNGQHIVLDEQNRVVSCSRPIDPARNWVMSKDEWESHRAWEWKLS